MTGALAVVSASAGSVLPATLAAGNSTGESGIGVNASGRITFGSDGTITYQGVNTETGSGPSQWCAGSPLAGVGNTVWIRATATSGTITTNPAAAFTLLSANRQFIKGPLTTDVSCTVTFDFSLDGVSTQLSSPGWVLQTSHV